MAMMESKVAGRSGGIRGLSVKVGVRSMALSERCRERIAKAIPSGDSRKSRNWARWSVRTKTPAHRMSSVAKAGQHRARPGKDIELVPKRQWNPFRGQRTRQDHLDRTVRATSRLGGVTD
ncbi:hypothetical protein B0H13DRAFT_1908831 [Mycena leptocephala]|nr:hypothetical protein B0H13DRAFT_1908831 [Mycena leptocephala]